MCLYTYVCIMENLMVLVHLNLLLTYYMSWQPQYSLQQKMYTWPWKNGDVLQIKYIISHDNYW